MKLRRALVAAAATAALAPAALFAAPAAFAEGDADADAAKSAQSSSASADPSGSADDTDGADDESSTAPSTSPSVSESGEPSGEPDPSSSSAPAGSEAPSSPAQSGSPSSSAPGEDDEDEGDEECTDTPQIKLNGFPSKLVAGGDWSKFTLSMKNNTEKTLEEVYPWIYATSLEAGLTPDELRLEYFNPLEKAWMAVPDVLDGGGFVGDGYLITMGPKQYLDIDMRLRFTKGAPVGQGISIAIGQYYNADGSCGYSETELYGFEIVAPGTDPGDVDEVEPQEGGKQPIDEKPQGGDQEIPVTGSLATTGSSSALPAIAAAGGAAVLLGAGAVFVVRRRRAAGAMGATDATV